MLILSISRRNITGNRPAQIDRRVGSDCATTVPVESFFKLSVCVLQSESWQNQNSTVGT